MKEVVLPFSHDEVMSGGADMLMEEQQNGSRASPAHYHTGMWIVSHTQDIY